MDDALPTEVDVVVVGAGPAGATVAALLAKYRPATRVLVLEKERFPRYKIGESLLVDTNRVLYDMGALEAVNGAGFTRKYGVSFVWGPEREPKTFLWGEGKAMAPAAAGYHIDYTYHVDRRVYDSLLVDCARRHGAQVVHGIQVRDVLRDPGGDPGDKRRVVGVRVQDEAGEHEIRATYVVDAAGGGGPLSRAGDLNKELDDDLRNIAVYAYYRGVGIVPHLTGDEAHRRTLLVTAPQGWLWIIPLMDGVTSVGFVTSLANYRASGFAEPSQFHDAMLRSLPEFELLFGGAQRVDYRGDGRMVSAVQEYSYSCERIHGPGWAAVGDASGFVDAILSIGCFVAHNHAQYLAYALASILDRECDEALAMQSYAETVQENLRAFRGVAHMFYAFNPDITEWWRECSSRLRASAFVPQEADREAFSAFFTGFAARTSLYEDALHAFDGQFLVALSEELFPRDRPMSHERVGAHLERAFRVADGNPVLRFAYPYKVRPFLLPWSGKGRLEPAARLDIDGASGDAGASKIARKIILPAVYADLPRRIDGSAPLVPVIDRFVAESGGRATQAEALRTVRRLAAMGALERVEAASSARAT
jgi:flavin-dependent dehydrogenase